MLSSWLLTLEKQHDFHLLRSAQVLKNSCTEVCYFRKKVARLYIKLAAHPVHKAVATIGQLCTPSTP